MKKVLKAIINSLFFLYVIVLLLFTLRLFGSYNVDFMNNPHWEKIDYYVRRSNFIPLKTIKEYVYSGLINTSHAVRFILGNLVCLAPLVAYLNCVLKWKFQITAIVSIAIAVIMELVQILMRVGSIDVDAVILRISGIILTQAIYLLIKRLTTHIIFQ